MNNEANIIKRKLNVLTEMLGKGKLQSINYAIDVAIASSRGGITFEQVIVHERQNKNLIHQSLVTQYFKMLCFENAYRNLIKWRNRK